MTKRSAESIEAASTYLRSEAEKASTRKSVGSAWGYLLWVGCAVLGLWIFFHGYLPARREAAETRDMVQGLRREVRDLESERDAVQRELKALERGDKLALRRALQREGLTEKGRRRVVEQR